MEAPTVPLDIAAEHYRDAMLRGVKEGQRAEMERIVRLLKDKKEYLAIAYIKGEQK